MYRILIILISLTYIVYGQNFDGQLSCPDDCGKNKWWNMVEKGVVRGMNKEFLRQLKLLENKCSFNLYITSGYRCEVQNKKVSGNKNSRHLFGLAVDIRIYDSDNFDEIETLAQKSGYFTRVIDEGDHIHLGSGDDRFSSSKTYDNLTNSLFVSGGTKHKYSDLLRVGYFFTDGYEEENFYLYYENLTKNNNSELINNQNSIGAAWGIYYDGPYWGINLSMGRGKLNDTKYSFIEPNINIGYIFKYIDFQLNMGYTITKPSELNNPENNNIKGLNFTAIVSLGIFKN